MVQNINRFLIVICVQMIWDESLMTLFSYIVDRTSIIQSSIE